MSDFFTVFLMYAGYDLIAVLCGCKVPSINIEADIKDKYFWNYQIIRVIIVTILFFITKEI